MSCRLRSQEGLTTIQPEPCQWVHHPEVTPAQGTRALVKWDTLYS